MSRFRILAAGIAVAAVVVLTTAAPASAHDELLSSTPTAGEALPSAPPEVSLTFSADVLDVGAAIIVADGAGRDWTAGEPVLQDDAVTVPLEADLPAAGYEVRWRVVSSDGHPISGVIPFTVGDGEPLERTAAPDAPAAGGTGETEDQIAQENDEAVRLVALGGTGAALAVAVFVALLLFRRRAFAGGADETHDAPSDES